MRQILVRIEDPKERESTRGVESEEIVAGIRSARTGYTGEIVAANRLKSGDILLQVTTAEARETLERETSWLSEKYKSARVLRKSFPVMVHGVKISSVKADDLVATQGRIEEDNQILHPGLEIVGVRWISSALRPAANRTRKRYSSLVVSAATPEMADEMIRKGVVDTSQGMRLVEKYDQSASSIQCYRCQGYGHMATTCGGKICCAECRQAHDTRDHEVAAPKAKKACAVCDSSGHTSYDPTCPFRIKEKKRAAQRVANKGELYNFQRSTPPTEANMQGKAKDKKLEGEWYRKGPKGTRSELEREPPRRRTQLPREEGEISPEKELDDTVSALLARFERTKTAGRTPGPIETAMIQEDLDRIRVLKQDVSRRNLDQIQILKQRISTQKTEQKSIV